MKLAEAALQMFQRQVRDWPLLARNVEELSHVRARELSVDGLTFRLQFNPARIVSATAKTDAASIAARPCFLCEANLPAEQESVAFGDGWKILANPFPILPDHFTIARSDHVPQRIRPFLLDMLMMTREMGPSLFLLYNGPKCGASAPDHMHFQAARSGMIPIEREIGEPAETISVRLSARPFMVVSGRDVDAVALAFESLHDKWVTGDDEPMMNLLSYFDGTTHRLVILPRTKHRPSFFFAEGDERILLSPASLDLGGVCVTPIERDFDRIDEGHLRRMLREVCPDADAMRQMLDVAQPR